jgi:glycine cleavage system H lipoate-binding protein
MVAILVLCSVAGFLLADWLITRRRSARESLATLSSFKPECEPEPALAARVLDPTADFFFHPGHTWAHRQADEIVEVGTDAFAPRFLGRLAQVLLPRPGTRFRQGDPAWAFVSAGGRALAMAMPVDGEVVEVNRRLLSEPDLAQRAPYAAGWVLRIQPDQLAANLQNLMPASAARDWLDAIRSRLTTRLAPALGLVATDGGEWAAVFGDQLDESTWETLKGELFPEFPGDNPEQAR